MTETENAVFRAALLWACVPSWGSYDDGPATEDTCEELKLAVEKWVGRKLPDRRRDSTKRVLRTYLPRELR